MPKASKAKKLVLVLATSPPVTGTREETFETAEAVETAKAVETAEVIKTAEAIEFAKVGKNGVESKGDYLNLAQVPCIWYPIILRKKSVSMLVLLDSGSEVNAIY